MFTCEQQLYNKADLDRHMKVGDSSGPLADSGFKGHPLCRFCKRRFYDNNELFKHMESAHEQCFLCRRHQPEKYVYYRDYAELEGERRWGWGVVSSVCWGAESSSSSRGWMGIGLLCCWERWA